MQWKLFSSKQRPNYPGYGYTCAVTKYDEQNDAISGEDKPYHTVTRIRRIYDIMQAELKSPVTSLSYISTSEVSTANLKTPVLGEHI